MRLIFKSGFIENKCMATKSERGVGWTEIGIGIYTLLCIK